MNKELICEIRILPNDKGSFQTECLFREFIENDLVERGGYYYFPNVMMRCHSNTLVLFQYDSKIRAIGILKEANKVFCKADDGEIYAGYYRFDVKTLRYLRTPIDATELRETYSSFRGFNQCKQIIPLSYLDKIITLIEKH